MEHTEQLNKILEQIRQEPLKDFETLEETARSAYPLLVELAQKGGAERCELDDLRVALRCNLRRNIIYDSEEEWKEKRTVLINAVVEAVKSGRDSKIWLRLLQDSLAGGEAQQIIDRLRDEQIDRNLFPALEAETEFQPTGRLMDWYCAMLDRSRQHKEQIYNRLAYFFLWYGEFNCDEDQAKHYFREMERQGIERRNPYPGTFGLHGHDEMIRMLLDSDADAAAECEPEGNRDYASFRLLTKYAKQQLEHVTACGMRGSAEKSEHEVGTVWEAWLEDPCCRDLRESMRRIYDVLLSQPSEEELYLFDDYLRSYGAALKQLTTGGGVQGAQGAQGEWPVQSAQQDRDKAVVFLLALLLNYDNWLLRIIDLESEPDCTDEQRYAGIEHWLEAIEPFCGKEFAFGDELLVMNSLQENLISYYEKQGNRKDMMLLLEQQVYGADAMAVLSGIGEDVSAEFFGQPYCTHNAMALLKLYEDTGEDAKAARLKKGIAETEEMLPQELWEGAFRESRGMLRKKYEALLAGGQEWTDQGDDAGQEDRTERDGKDCKGLLSISGYVIATRWTPEEEWALEHTFRPASPTLRGDFIRFVYSPPEGRDWFGMTEERREELINSITAT